jgi:hypothetical protein
MIYAIYARRVLRRISGADAAVAWTHRCEDWPAIARSEILSLRKSQMLRRAVFQVTQRPRRMRRLLSASSEGYSCASTPNHSLAPHHRSHTTIARSCATATSPPRPACFRVRRISIPWRTHRLHDSSPDFDDKIFIKTPKQPCFAPRILTICSFCRCGCKNVE